MDKNADEAQLSFNSVKKNQCAYKTGTCPMILGQVPIITKWSRGESNPGLAAPPNHGNYSNNPCFTSPPWTMCSHTCTGAWIPLFTGKAYHALPLRRYASSERHHRPNICRLRRWHHRHGTMIQRPRNWRGHGAKRSQYEGTTQPRRNPEQ